MGYKPTWPDVCLLSRGARGAPLPPRQGLGLRLAASAAPGYVCSLRPPQHPRRWSQEPLCSHTDRCTFPQSLSLQTQVHASFPQCRPHKLQQSASVKGMPFSHVLLYLNIHILEHSHEIVSSRLHYPLPSMPLLPSPTEETQFISLHPSKHL